MIKQPRSYTKQGEGLWRRKYRPFTFAFCFGLIFTSRSLQICTKIECIYIGSQMLVPS